MLHNYWSRCVQGVLGFASGVAGVLDRVQGVFYTTLNIVSTSALIHSSTVSKSVSY